jgi:hypothetical protein
MFRTTHPLCSALQPGCDGERRRGGAAGPGGRSDSWLRGAKVTREATCCGAARGAPTSPSRRWHFGITHSPRFARPEFRIVGPRASVRSSRWATALYPLNHCDRNLPPPIRPNTRSTYEDREISHGSLSDFSDYESSDEEAHLDAGVSSGSRARKTYIINVSDNDDEDEDARRHITEVEDPFADPFAD